MKVSTFLFFGLTAILAGACLSSSNDINNQIQQITKDTTTVSAFVSSNNITAAKIGRGVWFIIDSAGVGIRPVFSDTVKMSYTTKLMTDGTTASSSATPVQFPMLELMQALQWALPSVPQGSKGRIFVPSVYGYGNIANGSIPANSNLIFEFKLTQVADHHLKIDTAALDSYLATNSITAFKDVSGLRYTIAAPGSGNTPTVHDDVVASYTMKSFPEGAILQQTSAGSFRMADLIPAWQIGLNKIQEGGSMTLYVPSSLAFGPSGLSGYVNANTNVIFDIQLTKVTPH